jgi:hypothetical protein
VPLCINEDKVLMTETTRPKLRVPPLVVIPILLAVVYFYPRMLIDRFGLDSPWTSYFYQYGFGFLAFTIGIWIILSSGACQPGRGRDGFWFLVLIGGFVFFLLLHGVWIIAALRAPFLGGVS